MTATVHQLPTNNLERLGREIKNLWANSTFEFSKKMIEVGKMLMEAREQFPVMGRGGRGPSRPGWHSWIKHETKISTRHATNLINIARRFGDGSIGSINSLKLLSMLASEEVPNAAVAE